MKFIRTENGDIINLTNIVSIDMMIGEAKNEENGEVTPVFAVAAVDIQGKERELILCETEEEVTDIIDDICQWLAYSTEVFFDLKAEIDTEIQEAIEEEIDIETEGEVDKNE